MGCWWKGGFGLVGFLLAGCAVGPDFQPPPAPELKSYDAAELPREERVTVGGQPIAWGATVPARWWELFQSPRLARTLDDVVAGNNTLAAARSSLAQAEQAVIATRAAFLPQFDLAAGVQRSGAALSGPNTSTISNYYTIGPSVTYTLDAFGLTRRTVEQQEALADNQRYQLAAAYLSLTGGAVTEAIAIAAARLQVATVEEIVADDRRNLDLVRRSFDLGKAARTDVLTAESQLLGDQSQISGLRQQLSVARHALTVLAGRSAAEWSPPAFEMSEFTVPADLPVSIPSELVRQRPDILAAEAELHAASAAVGIATAQQYPTISLSGALTQQSLTVDSLFKGSSTVWSLGADLTAPVFHGGALEAQKQEAVEAFNAQLANYKQIVVQAFGQVADTLRALDHDAEFVANARRSLDVAETSAALQRASYGAGKTSVLDLIEAERANAQARLAFASAQIQQLQDSVQLFVVMGGSWRQR